MQYRELSLAEADRISEIDAECYIRNAWRHDAVSGTYELTEINWTDTVLPNGYERHLKRFEDAVAACGKAFGCFDDDRLIGYAVIGAHVFGETQRYILLDQLFISCTYRGRHIGSTLLGLCADAARAKSAEKLYLCAGSSEDTVAFYRRMGCVPAAEVVCRGSERHTDGTDDQIKDGWHVYRPDDGKAVAPVYQL